MHGVNKNTRTATTDEDGADHIGIDTPGSGVATPQPDLQDKRLPGIATYFGQVRQHSSTAASFTPAPSDSQYHALLGQAQENATSLVGLRLQLQPYAKNSLADSESSTPDCGLIQHERPSLESVPEQDEQRISDFYPTPPISQPSSSGGSVFQEALASTFTRPALTSRVSAPAPWLTKKSTASLFTTTHYQTLDDSLQLEHDTSRSTASLPDDVTLPPPQIAHRTSVTQRPPAPGKWYSFNGLKELTRVISLKSGNSTPIRTMSAARPSGSDPKESSSGRTSHDGVDASGTHLSRTSSSSQLPAQRGKLTIKVSEARGLRRSRDPYIVVVFQRSELISGGPRHVDDEDDNLGVGTPTSGGIPIQRSGSDSGRPMAIPMRSRQSSNTSVSDYNTFRNRPGRQSFTSPIWDAEAEL